MTTNPSAGLASSALKPESQNRKPDPVRVFAWHGASNTFPQWLQVDFNGSRTIGEIDVYTVQDNYANPSEPTAAMTFSLYGLSGYDVQYWDGSSWATVPAGSVTGNNKVWKKFTFTAITTTKIRVLTSTSVDGHSRLTEIEAWTATQTSSSSADINWLVTDQLSLAAVVLMKPSGSAALRAERLCLSEELHSDTFLRLSLRTMY